MDIMSTQTQQTICTDSCESERDRDKGMPRRVSQAVTREDRSVAETVDSSGGGPLAIVLTRRSVDWSDSVDDGQSEEDIMPISGKGHWFLEGWIGDHAVDFLVEYFAAEILHYEERDVGGGVHVYTVPLILARSKVHLTYGSQVVGVVAPV